MTHFILLPHYGAFEALGTNQNCMPLCLFALVSTFVPYDFDFNVGALMLQLCCIKKLCMTQSSLILDSQSKGHFKAGS